VNGKPFRGFESHPLRQIDFTSPDALLTK